MLLLYAGKMQNYDCVTTTGEFKKISRHTAELNIDIFIHSAYIYTIQYSYGNTGQIYPAIPVGFQKHLVQCKLALNLSFKISHQVVALLFLII